MGKPEEKLFETLLNRMTLASSAGELKESFEPTPDENFRALLDRMAPVRPTGAEYVELKDVEGFTTPAARNRNPGNLRDPRTGKFREFDSVQQGFAALVDDVKAKQTGRTRTGLTGDSSIAQFFAVYAPAHENPTAEYIRTVSKELGVSPSTKIGELDPVRLAHAIARFEDRNYWTAVTAASKTDAPTPAAAPPLDLSEFLAPASSTGQIRDTAGPGAVKRKVEETIAPSGVITSDIESRRAFLERQMEEAEPELPPIGTIGAAPEGFERAKRWLGNIRLFSRDGVLSSGAGRGGVDIGGMFRFGDQMMTPILSGGETGDFKGGVEQFFRTGGALALGMADMFVGAPVKLIYNEATGQDYLLPEERETMFKQTLANYAGLYVGLAAGNVFANRQMLGQLARADAPIGSLARAATADVATGWRARVARGSVEGLAGGAVTGAIEGKPGERLDLAASYALMALPLGIAFEAVLPQSKARFLNSDEGQRAVAQDLFHLRQLQVAGDATADMATARMFALASETDLAKALVRVGLETDEPVIVRGVNRTSMMQDLQKRERDTDAIVFHKRPDGTTDMLLAQSLTPAQRQSFQAFGFFDGEPVSYLGKDYEYVTGIVGKKGELEGHIVRDYHGREFEVKTALEHGHDVARTSMLPDRAVIAKRLYDDFRKYADNVFDENGNLRADAVEGEININEMLIKWAKERSIPVAELNEFSKFIQARFEDDVVRQALDSREYAFYQKLANETQLYREEAANSLPDLANAHGMYVDRARGGGIALRDMETNQLMGSLFSSPQAAREFLITSASARGLVLDGQGFPTIGSRFFYSAPDPISGAHRSAYGYMKDGPLRQFQHYLNTTWVGRHFTAIRQVMIAFDTQIGTQLTARVWNPLYEAFKAKHSAMHQDVVRVEAFSRFLRGMDEIDLDNIVTLQETRNAQQIINGELLSRPLTKREIDGANWFVKNRIDIRKAFEYRRLSRGVEAKFAGDPEVYTKLRELQAKMAIDDAHVQAAEVISTILKKDTPESLSLYGIIRLAEAIQFDLLSPEDFIKKNDISPRVVQAQKMMEAHFKELADKFQIPEVQRLEGYFAHIRRYGDDTVWRADPNVLPEFVHDLLRTGEMYDYNRNPVDVMMRYLNVGYNKLYVDTPWKAALEYVDKDVGKGNPALVEFVKRYYMYELRGVPHDSQRLSEGMLTGFLKKLGIEADIDSRRHFVNAAMSLTSTKFIGFRPMQGIRDVSSITSVFFARFGAARTKAMIETIAKWSPEELKAEGILKETRRGEGVVEAMKREGISPTLSPVQVLSGGELLSETLAGKAAKIRGGINTLADAGLKWGLQHNAYEWGHSAVYLESFFKAIEELNNMSLGKYGSDGVAAKRKAYQNLTIDQYDTPVIQEFDRLVTGGQYREAAKFLANASSVEIVSVLGLANNPAGWGTTGGRLFGQFGNWPTQMRSTIVRLGSRGSPKARAAALARYAMTQGAITATGAALGLAMGSWYLPFAGAITGVAGDISDALNAEDSEEMWESMRAATARGVFGTTIGSSLYAGGPFVSMLEASANLGNAYEGDDQQAIQELTNNWLIGAPMPLVAKDIVDAVGLLQEGYSPLRALARALSVRSTKEALEE